MIVTSGKMCIFFVCTLLLIGSSSGYAAKSNQSIYEDPYDVAAGGASLTRASQEGVLFSNPALMPFGNKFFRWFGSQFSLIAAKESIEFGQSLASGSATSDSGGSEEEETAEREKFIDDVFTTPIHFGATSALSFISSHFGVGVVSRFEPDIKGTRFSDTGIPAIRAQAEGYGAGVVSYAQKLFPWFSLGVTGKYIYKAEPNIYLDFADQARIDEIRSNPQALINEVTPGQGLGFDAGALLFLQGRSVDYRMAVKVDDFGNTTFTESQEPFKQIIHGGVGLTFHNSIDSLHLSLDFRDVAGAYEESVVMRSYAGAKLVLRNYIGFAAGLYQGYPSYGIRLDLIIVKLGLTYYAREMGSFIGDDRRNIYIAYFGFGI